MSYKLAKRYQELGDFDRAYTIAIQDWQMDCSLQWPRNMIAWLLIGIMKNNTRAYGKVRFFECLSEFGTLGIPADDTKLWGAVVWPIRDLINDSVAMQWFDENLGNELFSLIRDFPFPKPSDSYSALLEAFLSVGALWSKLYVFIDWWGLRNLTIFDRRRYPRKGVLTSLSERASEAYYASRYRALLSF